jgi:hypothetical protein
MWENEKLSGKKQNYRSISLIRGLQNFVIGNEVKTLFVIAELLGETQVPQGRNRNICHYLAYHKFRPCG